MSSTTSLPRAFLSNFLGQSPDWYKLTIVLFLVINPIVFAISPFVAGWVLIVEFIFTLAMALKCYPLQPGGLLAIEAVIIGMTSPAHVKAELVANLEVLLLLIFMVAGIYFMKDLLLSIFTKLLLRLRSKVMLSLAFCAAAAVLSAFLDALTVVAVIIAVATGFYAIYHKVASGRPTHHDDHDHTDDNLVQELTRDDLEHFRGFLRNLMMHASVGTALGGVCTMVGEPQNLIIAENAGWQFVEFLLRMAPITLPVFVFGLLTCVIVEKMHWFGYGETLPEAVRQVLLEHDQEQQRKRSAKDKAKLVVQGLVALWLVIGLALHLAAVGLIGLTVIILTTAACGVTEEHQLGKAFEESLPFTALLAVFFTVVAVIIDQKLFTPVIDWVLHFEGEHQLGMFYIANGLLSMVSDNVFVGTVYINEVHSALNNGLISRDQFDMLAVAINTGTNLPSVATPNGQAAFLFLLTSTLAPLLRLSYGRMVWMALPYTIVLTFVGLFAVYFLLPDLTHWLYSMDLISHHEASAGAKAATIGH